VVPLFDERDQMHVAIQLNHKDPLARVLCRVRVSKDVQQPTGFDSHNDGLKRQSAFRPQRLTLVRTPPKRFHGAMLQPCVPFVTTQDQDA